MSFHFVCVGTKSLAIFEISHYFTELYKQFYEVLAFLFLVCYVILYSICSVFGDAFEYLYFILYLCIVLLIFWRTNLKLSNHYLCYVNAGMWSVRVKQVVNAITLTPV